MAEPKDHLSNRGPLILVTGANGQLGNELRILEADYPQFKFLFTGKAELPLEKENIIRDFFESQQIDYCINCAAYTAVDKAEQEKERAFLINGEAVGHLAKVCKAHHCKLLHISTDYVYDGSARRPLKENDSLAPLNVYGQSKLRGEELALKNYPDTLILRTSWVYSSFGNNFVKTMLRLFAEKEALNIVSDQLGSPTYAADIANVLLTFIEQREAGNNFSGIVNYSNYGITSWYQFAEYLKEITASSCQLNPVSSYDYKTAATRPLYSVLDTSKIRNLLPLDIPFWKDSVAKCVDLILGQQTLG